MLETEVYAVPLLSLSEGHLSGLLRGQLYHRVAKLLGKLLHHTAIDGTFDKGRHTLGHRQGELVRATQMIVGHVNLHGLAQLLDVVGKLLGVHLEKRIFHHDERVLALDDVTGIAHHVVRVVHMQLVALHVIGGECSRQRVLYLGGIVLSRLLCLVTAAYHHGSCHHCE